MVVSEIAHMHEISDKISKREKIDGDKKRLDACFPYYWYQTTSVRFRPNIKVDVCEGTYYSLPKYKCHSLRSHKSCFQDLFQIFGNASFLNEWNLRIDGKAL